MKYNRVETKHLTRREVFLACKAEWRKDNTNVIVVPYKKEEE